MQDRDWEKASRRVRNKPLYIKPDGTFTSALYKDSKGVSINKDHSRGLVEIILDEERLHQLYNGNVPQSSEKALRAIVTITKEQCEIKSVNVVDAPEKDNPHHALLKKNEKEIELTDSQAKYLARNSVLIKRYF